jgi:hypothetical protein
MLQASGCPQLLSTTTLARCLCKGKRRAAVDFALPNTTTCLCLLRIQHGQAWVTAQEDATVKRVASHSLLAGGHNTDGSRTGGVQLSIDKSSEDLLGIIIVPKDQLNSQSRSQLVW